MKIKLENISKCNKYLIKPVHMLCWSSYLSLNVTKKSINFTWLWWFYCSVVKENYFFTQFQGAMKAMKENVDCSLPHFAVVPLYFQQCQEEVSSYLQWRNGLDPKPPVQQVLMHTDSLIRESNGYQGRNAKETSKDSVGSWGKLGIQLLAREMTAMDTGCGHVGQVLTSPEVSHKQL